MSVKATQYIPNPLVPQDPEGKDLYLVAELNKIAQWMANDRSGDESDTDPTDPPPDPDHQHFHDNLIQVTADQHHPQIHAHNTHTGIGPDDHHPQLHVLDSHTDVVTVGKLDGEALMWDSVALEWQNKAPRAESWPTGLINGGELNIIGGTDIQVVAGLGVIVDSYSLPEQQPQDTRVQWVTLQEPITASPATAGSIVWFTINSLGAIVQYSAAPTQAVRRDELALGLVIHNGTSWGEVSSPTVINNSAHTLEDYLNGVSGPTFVIDGGEISEQTLFTLKQETGTTWEMNRNWHVDKKNPHRENFLARAPMQFRYTSRDFTAVGALTSTVDPILWDNAGVVEAVPLPANTATVQRIYIDPRDNIWILYGQNTYATFDEALALIGADTAATEIPPLLAGSVLLGYVVSSRNQTDWSPTAARFVVAGGGGTGSSAGAPITDHDLLNGITPDNHHNQVHTLFSSDHSDVNITTPLDVAQGLWWDGVDFIPDWRLNFVATYAEGPLYPPQTMVRNSSYISISNVATVEPAFPIETGTLQTIYPDLPPFLEASNVSLVRSGYNVIFTQSGEIRSLEVWIPEVTTDTHFTMVSIDDPNGTPVTTRTELANQSLTAGQWNTVSLASKLYIAGQEVLIYLESSNFGAESTVTGGWVNGGQQNTAAPATSEWNYNNANSVLRIDKTDLDTLDRTSELMGIITGSTIQFVETASPTDARTYTVTGPPVDAGTFIQYQVSLDSVVGSDFTGTVSTMTATIPIAQSTKFVYEEGKFTPQPAFVDATSFLQYGDVAQTVADDIGYGINFDFQQLQQSADWNLIILGGGGGGGGDFIPATFTGAGTTGYVPDPGTEDGSVLKDDGTWGAAGGGSTESKISQTAHGFAVGEAIRFNGVSWVLAQADVISTTALGLVVAVSNVDNFTFAMSGRYQLPGLTPNEWYYLSDTVAGALSTTEPLISQPIVYAEDGTWVVIYPYRPSYSAAPSDPMVGEIKQFTGDPLTLAFGWHVCDGLNGTLNLQDRFIIGAGGAHAVNAVGGGGSTGSGGGHSHTIPEDGYHAHTFTTDSGGGPTDLLNQAGAIPAGNHTHTGTTSLAALHDHGGTGAVASHTHAQADPLFHALYYIQYTGVA